MIWSPGPKPIPEKGYDDNIVPESQQTLFPHIMKNSDLQTAVLALDFDGVVVDSIRECLVVAANALVVFQERSDRISQLDELGADLAREARRIRNFIRHGQDYVSILYALQQKVNIQNQQDFDTFLEANKSLNAQFRRLFYEERSRFLREQPEQWLALNPLYRGMSDFLKAWQNQREHFFIITTKLRENVLAITEPARIAILPEQIFSADDRLSKTEIIRNLLRQLQIEPEQFHFIDDQVDTLIRAQVTGVNLYLAEWGYNNADQVQLARDRDLKVLSLKNFYDLFGGFAPPE
jgi:phosphoglycolate phosphatase-like HAD superfamily hydrolase